MLKFNSKLNLSRCGTLVNTLLMLENNNVAKTITKRNRKKNNHTQYIKFI